MSGTPLADARHDRGWSQEALAARSGLRGLTMSGFTDGAAQ